MACSTTAVQLTVNQWVAGSNPATPVDRILILSYTTSCVKEDALGEQSPTLRVQFRGKTKGFQPFVRSSILLTRFRIPVIRTQYKYLIICLSVIKVTNGDINTGQSSPYSSAGIHSASN